MWTHTRAQVWLHEVPPVADGHPSYDLAHSLSSDQHWRVERSTRYVATSSNGCGLRWSASISALRCRSSINRIYIYAHKAFSVEGGQHTSSDLHIDGFGWFRSTWTTSSVFSWCYHISIHKWRHFMPTAESIVKQRQYILLVASSKERLICILHWAY